MKSHPPVCFIWAFLTKFRSVTVPSSQFHSHSEYTHQKITQNSQLPDTPAMQVRYTNIFLFFLLCKRPCLLSPARKSHPPARRQKEQATKRCHPMVSPVLLLTEVGNNSSPPAGAPFRAERVAHTPCSPLLAASPHCPKHAWSSQGPPSGSLNRWFSEGKNLGAKQGLW